MSADQGIGIALAPTHNPDLCCTATSLHLWDHDWPLHVPQAPDIPQQMLYGNSLELLVARFGAATLVIWGALLDRRPVLFVGQPASDVGQCCLACLNLIVPLLVPPQDVLPHLALSDAGLIEGKPFFVAGSTNEYFAARKEYGDIVCHVEVCVLYLTYDCWSPSLLVHCDCSLPWCPSLCTAPSPKVGCDSSRSDGSDGFLGAWVFF